MPDMSQIVMTRCFSSTIGKIELSDSVLECFDRNRQKRMWSAEAGGQLFCRFSGDAILVEAASGPKRKDKRNRYSFWPDRQNEQKDIEIQFSAGLHYIGDWHTHPEDIPEPSGVDLHKMQAIFRKSDHQLKGMLLVVVGRNSRHGGLWVGVVSSHSAVQAKPVDFP